MTKETFIMLAGSCLISFILLACAHMMKEQERRIIKIEKKITKIISKTSSAALEISP